jgi:hypothetical protein
MTVYSLMLFLHVGAALAPASALSIDALIVVQLRRAASPSPTKACLDLWRTVPGLAGGSGLCPATSPCYFARAFMASLSSTGITPTAKGVPSSSPMDGRGLWGCLVPSRVS